MCGVLSVCMTGVAVFFSVKICNRVSGFSSTLPGFAFPRGVQTWNHAPRLPVCRPRGRAVVVGESST